jgi:hypothetical protein
MSHKVGNGPKMLVSTKLSSSGANAKKKAAADSLFSAAAAAAAPSISEQENLQISSIKTTTTPAVLFKHLNTAIANNWTNLAQRALEHPSFPKHQLNTIYFEQIAIGGNEYYTDYKDVYYTILDKVTNAEMQGILSQAGAKTQAQLTSILNNEELSINLLQNSLQPYSLIEHLKIAIQNNFTTLASEILCHKDFPRNQLNIISHRVTGSDDIGIYEDVYKTLLDSVGNMTMKQILSRSGARIYTRLAIMLQDEELTMKLIQDGTQPYSFIKHLEIAISKNWPKLAKYILSQGYITKNELNTIQHYSTGSDETTYVDHYYRLLDTTKNKTMIKLLRNYGALPYSQLK